MLSPLRMHNDAIGQARWTARSTWATSRASGQKFLIESGKDGDVTELMTPVRALLRLEVTKPVRRRRRTD